MPPVNPPARFSPRFVGAVAALLTILIWSAFIVVARASADPARQPTLGAFDIVFARLLGAGLVLLPMGWWITRKARRLAAEQGKTDVPGSLFGLSPLPLRVTVQMGMVGGLLYGMLAYSGFAYAPAAHASVLMPGSLPLWTALLALIFLGDRITTARLVGLVCIVGGDLLVGGASLLNAFDGSGVWRGDVLFIAASVVWSSYTVMVRKHGVQAVDATVSITVFAALIYLPVYGALMLAGLVPARLLSAPWQDVVFQMLMQGVGSVVVSGITFNLMIRHYGPVRSTMLTAVVPGLSALMAGLLLGEPLPWNVLAGLALVTLGIVFGVYRVSKAAGAGAPVSATVPAAAPISVSAGKV